jgi:hypothetical protein
VTTFGAIAIIVLAFVVLCPDRFVEEVFSLLDLVADFGKVGHFEWRSIFLDEHHQRDAIENEVVLFEVESFLGEVIGLVYEVEVLVYH